MTTTQIVLLVLAILVFISYFVAIDNSKPGFLGFISILLITVIAFICIASLAATLKDKSRLEKQLKSKCLEYEKVENVYKLK